MHKIDGAGHASNAFTEGNPGAGIPATTVTGDWLNAVQAEIVNVIEGAGITLSKPTNTQLRTAIAKMVDSANRAVILDTVTFAGAVANGEAVYWDATNTRFDKALADGTAKQSVVGVADVTNTRVFALGAATLFSGLTPGSRYFLSTATAGALTTVMPAANAVQVGIAKSATEMYVDPDPLVTSSYNVGDIVFTAGAAAPSGTVKANGALLSRTTYARLYDWANTNSLIVAEATWSADRWGAFGAGDGSTTFRIPDLRGEFLRGFDDGRGVDASRVRGSWQVDLFKSHSHGPAFIALGGGPSTVGSGVVNIQEPAITATGGAETRPRNVALLACIAF
jgi:hypothetical protein